MANGGRHGDAELAGSSVLAESRLTAVSARPGLSGSVPAVSAVQQDRGATELVFYQAVKSALVAGQMRDLGTRHQLSRIVRRLCGRMTPSIRLLSVDAAEYLLWGTLVPFQDECEQQ